MEEVLRSLVGLLLKAIPTFILVVLLHLYLKRVYFRPMARVLEQRHAATEGARQKAEESLARAAEKAAEYESALRRARAEIYREQEDFRQQLRQEHARSIAEARRNAGSMVKQAQEQLGAELVQARESLRLENESLAEQIVRAVLRRSAA